MNRRGDGSDGHDAACSDAREKRRQYGDHVRMIEPRDQNLRALRPQVAHQPRQRAQNARDVQIDNSHQRGDVIQIRATARSQHEVAPQPQRRELVGQVDEDALGTAPVEGRQEHRH